MTACWFLVFCVCHELCDSLPAHLPKSSKKVWILLYLDRIIYCFSFFFFLINHLQFFFFPLKSHYVPWPWKYAEMTVFYFIVIQVQRFISMAVWNVCQGAGEDIVSHWIWTKQTCVSPYCSWRCTITGERFLRSGSPTAEMSSERATVLPVARCNCFLCSFLTGETFFIGYDWIFWLLLF